MKMFRDLRVWVREVLRAKLFSINKNAFNFDLKDIAGELGGVIKTIDISDDYKDNNDPTLSPDLINAARKAKLRFPDFVEIKGEPCDFVFFEAVEKLDNSPIPFHEAKDKVLEEWKKNKLDQIRKNNADSFG